MATSSRRSTWAGKRGRTRPPGWKSPSCGRSEALARLIAEASEGDLRDDARGLETYCAVARANPRSKQGLWSRLQALAGEDEGLPDCAEAVKADARVCRFCGYRFEEV